MIMNYLYLSVFFVYFPKPEQEQKYFLKMDKTVGLSALK